LKKRTKKDFAKFAPVPKGKSLFASFSSEKEESLLTSLPTPDTPKPLSPPPAP
jgi:hypothetical protein